MARRVLITGARAAAALDLARDFAAAGWEPHLADCTPARIARWSRVPAIVHRYPAPRQDAAGFRARIAELVDRHDFEFIVPTCEEVFHLAAPPLQARLGERLLAPDLAVLRQLHDKLAFADACKAWGLPSPESHLVETREDLKCYADESRKWVFKQRFSRFGEAAVIAPASEQLARINPGPASPWMAQRHITGEEASFYAASHRGRLTAFAAYSSRWRLGGGACYAFKPLSGARMHKLRAIAEILAEKSAIHGQFACDVIFDAQAAPFLIECNPRATSGAHLLTGKGHLARALAEGTVHPDGQSVQTAFLAPAMLLFGLPQALRKGRLRDWHRCVTNGRDALSRRSDRWPLAGAVVDAAGFFAGGLRRGVSTNAATTRDIEWNGEEMP